MISEKEIWAKLDGMYQDKKSQKFVDHLIKSYIPKSKVEKIVETPKGRFRCALTNLNLVAIGDVYTEIGDNDKFKTQFIKFVDTMFSDAVVNPPKINLLKRRSVGLTGVDTDTFLRYETFIAFFNWVENKIIEDDKHIIWLINQMQVGDGFRMNKIKEDGSDKIKIEFVTQTKKGVSTFADLDILHELKSKLKEEERK